MKILLSIVVFLLLSASAAAEQRVGRILYFGNATTQEYVLRRALDIESGDIFSTEALEAARERFAELEVVEYADVQPKFNADDTVDLVITVDEIRRLRWGLREYINRQYGGFYIGPQFEIRNVRGRAETVSGRATWGALHSYHLNWINPHILGSAHLRIFLDGAWRRHSFEYKPFRFRDSYGRAGLGRTLFRGLDLDAFYELREVEIDQASSPWSEGKSRDDAVVVLLEHDSRDEEHYPNRGLHATAEARFSSVAQDRPYQIYRFDAAGFWTVPVLQIVGGRLGYATSGQRLPVYERMYLGGPGDLRGVDFGSLEGDQAYIASIEARRSILEFPKFHVGVHAFHDWGKAYDNGSAFEDAPLARGYGFGLHLNIASRVHRVDWGWDEEGDMRVFLESGFTF